MAPPAASSPARTHEAGISMFARYAYAPNALGYCGPPGTLALRAGSPEEIRAAARQFTGVWPYLRVMGRLCGISDPLDGRLVESYWHGGGVGAALDRATFLRELLAVIGPVAGHYWTHLTAELTEEAAPDHGFHVFGVYPWTRLLGRGADETAIHVLDSCRISPALVVARDGPELTVRIRPLHWDGHRLTLSTPEIRHLPAADYDAIPDATPGDIIALHWNHPCGRLTPDQLHNLATSTDWQLAMTNRRLGRPLPVGDPHG
ncbi:DUF6390 family protein [Nocardia albiluteola]|nr:DUF6390 family protein [Nocardia albiluteola]